jgi:N-carbamoyl-L-amino-acid hydrolase
MRGGLSVAEALATVGVDGSVLGDELARIGYAGPAELASSAPRPRIELHIEQGPILEREGFAIGAVEDLQGISW